MDHHEIRHALSDYLDGSLSKSEQAEIEAHLKTCTSCATSLDELRKTIDHVKSLEQVDPPAWMAQKIMARVREENAQKKAPARHWFFPFRFPVETVGLVLLAVTAFFMYRNMESSVNRLSEQAVGTETATPAVRQKPEPARSSAPAKGPVPQKPGYKALDMKQEYEPPQAPVPEKKKAPSEPTAPAPALKSAPRAAAPSAESREDTQSAVPMRETAALSGLTAKTQRSVESLDRMASGNKIEKVILDRYEDGSPRLIETYLLVDSKKVKRTEEQFKADGSRHGIQKDFYSSGQVRTEAEYENGKLVWYQEYQADGVKKIGKSDFNWYWLKK